VTSRKEFLEAHEGYEFRQFKCSGSCGTVIEALAHSQLWCNQPGCRGSMRPSYRVSAKRLANDQFEAAHRGDQTPRSTPRFPGFLASETPQNLSGHPITPGGKEGSLILAFTMLANELISRALAGRSFTLLVRRELTSDEKGDSPLRRLLDDEG